MIKKVCHIFFIIVIPITVISCSDILFLKGRVAFETDNCDSTKTIMPEGYEIAGYLITFTNENNGKSWTTNIVDCADPIVIAEGIWNISVKAYNSDGLSIAGDQIDTVEIVSGELTTVPINLSPVEVGIGEIDIKVTWPENVMIDEITAQLYDTDLEITEESETSCRFQNEVDAKYYVLKINAAYGSSTSVKMEAVHIYADAISVGQIDYVIDDFNPSVEIEIINENPDKLPVTFDVEQDTKIMSDELFSVSVIEEFDNYTWYLDGENIGSGNNVEINCSDYSLGVHHLSVITSDAEILYSNTLRFYISN
jgi:hypothetical protein